MTGKTTFAPAFARRAFVSDLMTWQYEKPDRYALHLQHDREFIHWMAARGINAFSYIRHERDSRLKIEELLPLLNQQGIASEYGGHVLRLLLPRDAAEERPRPDAHEPAADVVLEDDDDDEDEEEEEEEEAEDGDKDLIEEEEEEEEDEE